MLRHGTHRFILLNGNYTRIQKFRNSYEGKSEAKTANVHHSLLYARHHSTNVYRMHQLSSEKGDSSHLILYACNQFKPKSIKCILFRKNSIYLLFQECLPAPEFDATLIDGKESEIRFRFSLHFFRTSFCPLNNLRKLQSQGNTSHRQQAGVPSS